MCGTRPPPGREPRTYHRANDARDKRRGNPWALSELFNERHDQLLHLIDHKL
jgi:hypothetical protein